MRRHWIWPVLLVLVMGLTACQVEITPTPMPDDSSKASDPAPVPPPPDSGTANPNTGNTAKPGLSGSSISGPVGVVEPAVPDDNDKESSRASQDYTMEGYRWYLEGEWIGVEGEIEGDRLLPAGRRPVDRRLVKRRIYRNPITYKKAFGKGEQLWD